MFDAPKGHVSFPLQACVLAVPKLYIHYRGRDEAQYLRRMGYREVEVPAKSGGPPTKQYESTDQYTARMQGYMLFYGALVQSERPGNPHDLSQGWQYIARCAPKYREQSLIAGRSDSMAQCLVMSLSKHARPLQHVCGFQCIVCVNLPQWWPRQGLLCQLP